MLVFQFACFIPSAFHP